MSVLSLKDVEKSYGGKAILKGVSFCLDRGDRAGLIGINGSGKTTLLEIISGRLAPDSGRVVTARGASIGYLTQVSGASGATVLEEMLSARPDVLALRKRLDASAGDVGLLASGGGRRYEQALEEYGKLLEEFERSGGYAYDNAVSGALVGLGFGREDFGRRLDTLSGGQRTRLSLAKLLLAGHEVLLLDEPTNHLDISSIAWLEEFINQYDGTVLLVSHDRYFLDKAAVRIIELEAGMVEEYPGSYGYYREEKERRTAERLRQFELAQARFEKEKEYINRMRAGVNARQAKGREKRLKRFELPDRPTAGKKALELKWDDTARSSDTVLKAEGVSKSFVGADTLKEVTFTLRRGERVGVVGRNGCGKSTLLRLIMGELGPETGQVTLGPKVKPAYYAQGLEGLDENNTVLEELWSVEPLAEEQKVRDMLGVFLFSGEDALKNVGFLSGGEKGRLALAKVVMLGANLLVLDEPTNHLDIPSREALEDALSCFGGTVLAVSHDRYFLDSFADKVFEIEDGRLTGYWGNYTYYHGKKAQEAESDAPAVSEGRLSWEERKQKQALEKKRERDERRKAESLKEIENSIEELELKLKEAEEKLADPVVYGDFGLVSELTRCYNDLKARRDELYDLLEKEAF